MGYAHLAQVVGGQFEAMGGKTLLHRLQRGGVRLRLHSQDIQHHIDRAVVLSWTKSPGYYDNRGALRQFFQGTPHGRGLVSHDPLFANLQARIGQSFRQKSRVGVGHLAAQDLVPYGQNG